MTIGHTYGKGGSFEALTERLLADIGRTYVRREKFRNERLPHPGDWGIAPFGAWKEAEEAFARAIAVWEKAQPQEEVGE